MVLERGPVDEPLLRRAATRLRNAASHGITACAMLRRFRDDRLSFDEATDILAALKRNPLVAGVDRSGVARELSTLVRIDCTCVASSVVAHFCLMLFAPLMQQLARAAGVRAVALWRCGW